ncbi:MAG: cysteine desulfurase [Gammaproteobacteria bacterium]|nr:cysteine desulfurase [Gammaproteobacteria bacterium]MDE2345421.1 cysteine desulfurase [Gammaproteobacteria bacterium]
MAIYLDHNATTPLDSRVLDAMLPWLEGVHGNPSSIHRPGRAARDALDKARAQVAALVNARPTEVVFTSGGTEADNLALKGVCHGKPGGRLLISAIEHAAIMGPAGDLGRMGWQVERVPVDGECRLKHQALQKLLDRKVRLVSVMLANNETGVLQDVQAVAAAAHGQDALLHTDAIQAAGKLPVDFAALEADLLSLSAHKFGGPRGVGALIVHRRVGLLAQISGGGQERGLRGGTENLAGVVGFGAAAELAQSELQARMRHMRRLRDALESGLHSIPGVHIFAQSAQRLPNTVQLGLAGIHGEAAVMELDRHGIAVSSGSACHSGSGQPSHVLLAMGVEEMQARSAVRISIGGGNSLEDIHELLAALKALAASHSEALEPA